MVRGVRDLHPGVQRQPSRTDRRRNGVRPALLAPRVDNGSFLFDQEFEWTVVC
jgi:hypothetical protein